MLCQCLLLFCLVVFVVVLKKSRLLLLLLLLLGINGWVGLLRGTHNKGFGWGAVVGDVVGSSGTRPRAVGLGEGTGCGEMKKKRVVSGTR